MKTTFFPCKSYLSHAWILRGLCGKTTRITHKFAQEYLRLSCEFPQKKEEKEIFLLRSPHVRDRVIQYGHVRHNNLVNYSDKSYAHHQYAYVQSFKLTAWKPWEELITQTYDPIWKPNLKVVEVENAVILSFFFFACIKSHAHVQYDYNIYVQSLQTCYPMLKANHKIV